MDITHKVLIQGEFQKHVAREFRVSQGAISNVVRRFKEDPQHFKKLQQKREEKESKRQAVVRTVGLMQQQHMAVESSAQVAQLTKELTTDNLKTSLISEVLRKDLGMRFRRIQKVPLHLNTEKNLVLRQ